MAENNSVIHSVAVIGAGTMGRGIAYLLAQNGIRTLLYNRSGNNLNHELMRMWNISWRR
ncbi:3-hydroxyacyl-CoA dehydrogenase NAD-binding domain-containing protein [Serratia quinivorans]|uniref:3-hydroxyacyl-CoA dehydrogenase NAD-binding domain-containing protein n=1 Tax=Serratia quinivorans TaxID=137545 RepID=UPI00217B8E9C|nr:3-hydroxy-acyl-CoA dehydrogenase [Serratia quinivorans]CAI0882761.1 3-hydroxy-acyl-CoA dehydrogenase [Serratia quinivorans]CAI0908230.1 3-hydroxy-acyl-CoA dehydrogenase [Serratia quinivorans]CAI1509870.1 3-hydroxy-acyl-CoA dehydrogenase [Serratia quinivorans]CAI2054707.1 3-hydroxy-acyl-CoA dehydrogenase [Serratia quinivorans]